MNTAAQPYPSAVANRSRRRSLPALGLPAPRERQRASAVLSTILHVLIIALLVYPVALHTGDVIEQAQGAGGPGPAGGGGGGRGGTGGVRDPERIRYVQVAPQPVVPPPVPVPEPKPVVEPPKPVVPPPEPIKVQEPTPEAKPEIKIEPPKAEVASLTPGTGGGSGRDGSAGSGPGAGGGVGSGIGTGRGSGIGPGTGGGAQENYPPSPTELFIPPLPMPDRVRGFHLVAEYDIDETGKIVDFKFTPTRDRDYNKRLDEVLRSFRFRPGTKPDGTPIRMKAQIIYDF